MNENAKMTCAGILVPVFLLFVVLVGLALYFGAFTKASANVDAAQATSQAQITPMSEVGQVGIHGMDKIAEVAGEGFSSNVKIAASGDAAQTAMSAFQCMSSWAWPVGLAALAVLAWLFRKGGAKDEK